MSWHSNIQERVINLRDEQQVSAVRNFLHDFGLSFDATVEYTVAFYENEQIIATGSLAGEVLRNIAVAHTQQGSGLTSSVVSHLMGEASRRGRHHYFIYTKPQTAHLFSALGFVEIARAEPYVVLLEAGLGSIKSYCENLSKLVIGLQPGPRAAVIVNCNPFTLGHQALIKKAALENTSLVVMVVEEDRSLFPFDVRFKLVCEGLAEHDNILVIPSGKYVVSAATFPDYFTRGPETILAQTRLDVAIFAKYIAPALGVTRRYIGEEPYCEVTNAYNQAMLEFLPQHGIEIRLMPRLAQDGLAISASRVRTLIREDKWEELRAIVPATTYRYLRSPEAQTIIQKIKSSHSRH